MKPILLAVVVLVVLAFNWTPAMAQYTEPSFSPDSTHGRLWGYVFGDYYSKTHADSARRGLTQYSGLYQGDNAFSFRRIYLGYDFYYNKSFSAHIVMAHEDNYESNNPVQNYDQSNARDFYIKYANLQWDNIFPGSNIMIGAIPTPVFPITEEPLWGYRMDERTLMDMRNVMSSNDMGVNLGGKIWKTYSDADMKHEDAMVGYNVMVGNGNGPKLENNTFKRTYADVFTKFLEERVTVDLYGDYQTLQASPYAISSTVFRALAAYKVADFDIGVEAFWQNVQNGDIDSMAGVAKWDTSAQAPFGWSIFGAATFLKNDAGEPRLGVTGRLDFYNPDTKYVSNAATAKSYYGPAGANSAVSPSPSNTQTFINLGLDYTPNTSIHIMPNVWYNSYNNRKDGVTGKLLSDYDMVYRITFFFYFNNASRVF